MAAELKTFIDLFGAEYPFGEDVITLEKISIPMIQRDYAQGRNDIHATRVRERFLGSLKDALVNSPITLDFVYGDINDCGTMTLLDGQQRLTTLFLLHWYAAKRDNVDPEQYACLSRFSYETRYSAREFCVELVKFNPSFDKGPLSEEIINQPWFPLGWKKDPTISSMLTMIDSINEQFSEVPDIWKKLENGKITFYFLPIGDMGLTDELYIKMNSRGKPLTPFENFKAELERELETVDKAAADRIASKIDREWTDLLWRYRNSGTGLSDDSIIDDEFLRYFKFICDVICYSRDDSPRERSSDELDLIQIYFSTDSESVSDNIKIFESLFDCWLELGESESPAAFFSSLLASEHAPGKVKVSGSVDIFQSALRYYGRQRLFTLKQFVLLYSICLYLLNKDSISLQDFRRRLRVVNNLIRNSDDELVDRSDRNGISPAFKQVDSIILNGEFNESISGGFNAHQLREEKEKLDFLRERPDLEDAVFGLEDHELLFGQIGILGLENIQLADRFRTLFQCDYDLVDRAMMSVGDYSQRIKNGKTYQVGSGAQANTSSWSSLFHRSNNAGFDNTKAVLANLLNSSKGIDDEFLSSLGDSFVEECEKQGLYPWSYYYVRYQAFRPGKYGKISIPNKDVEPYLCTIITAREQISENAYIPYLKIADADHVDRDFYGQRLTYADCFITCTNNGFEVHERRSRELLETIAIQQNADGVDIENRVDRLEAYLIAKGLKGTAEA